MVKRLARTLAQSLVMVTLVTSTFSHTANAGWETQWIDPFEGSGVNFGNWTAQTQADYNNEEQCYTDDDSSADKNYEISGGTLKIIARRQADTNACSSLGNSDGLWTSGRLNSKDKREFLYGRIESRLRMHNLQGGTWPAFWMLEGRINEQPIKGDGDNVAWNGPGAGEIDVWEWFSNNPATYITNFFNTSGCGGLRTYPYPGGGIDVLQWHDYAIEWTPDTMRFLVDDIEVVSYNVTSCAQYKEPMFVLINLAIGGMLGGAVDPSLNLATLEIDYVAHCTATTSNTSTRCNESTPTAIGSVADDLIIFDDSERTDWPAWDSVGGTTPTVVTDSDPFKLESMEFMINGNTVVGFTSRAPYAVNGEAFDASTIATDGTLEFDLKMTNSPGATDWKLKVESNGAASKVEVSLSSSIEGHIEPVLNTWQHYSFKLSDLLTMGLDLSAIDIVMIFPEFGTGDGAVYRLDNVKILGNLPQDAPVVTSTANTAATANSAYNYTLHATDTEGDSLTLGAPILPAWLSFSAASGRLSGTPVDGDVGSHDVSLTVNDGTDTVIQSFIIIVSAEPNGAPTVTSSASRFVNQGQEYRYTLEATDPEGDPLTLSSVTLPNWLTFENETALLAGTPGADDIGSHRISLMVDDGTNTTTHDITVVVLRNGVSDDTDSDKSSSDGGGGSISWYLLCLLGCWAGVRRWSRVHSMHQ